MGIATGLTAVGIIYSPWGKRSGAPNMLGIAPMSPANLVTSILGLRQGHILAAVVRISASD